MMPQLIETLNHSLTDATFWIGLFSVFLFAHNRFDVSLPGTDELSPPIVPRSFTTRFRYHLASLTYDGLYVFVYFGLLFIGCFPVLQSILQQWIGAVDVGNADAGGTIQKIGTPAWAALAATSLIPSAPGFKKIDERLRDTLQEFASIPSKARMIGQEILRALPTGPVPVLPDNPDQAALATMVNYHRRRFDALRGLQDRLTQLDDERVRRRYEGFFSANNPIPQKLQDDFSIQPDHLSAAEAVQYVEKRMAANLNKAARFVACAMLETEASEFSIRRRLQRFGFNIRIISFDFKFQSVIVALVTIAIMTLIGCYIAAAAYAAYYHLDALQTMSDNTDLFISWVFIRMLAYGLPIIYSAGVVLYLLDRRSSGEALEFSDQFTAAALTFISCAGIAFLTMLTYNVVLTVLGLRLGTLHPLQILPWSLPSATLATVFLIMSSRETIGESGKLVDAAVYGAATALASIVAVLLAMRAGATFDRLPHNMVFFLAPITASVIGASTGTILGIVTRPKIRAIHAWATAPSTV